MKSQGLSSSTRSFLILLSSFVQLAAYMTPSISFAFNVIARPTVRNTAGQKLGTTGASCLFVHQLSRPLTGLSNQLEEKDDNEKMKGDKHLRRLLQPLVVCGPSGVGKGTIISRYMNDFGGSNHFGFTVSHTTRKPREGEIDGVHYHFVPHDVMKDEINRGKFIEYAEVHGNLYGTSFDSMRYVWDTLGKNCLLDIDVQGVKRIKELQESNDELGLHAKFIFIAPPSLDDLRERLLSRGTETEESLERRTKSAAAELEYGLAEGNFDCIIVNADLDKACQEFDQAVKDLYAKR